jgi:acyl carrier protein
MAKRILTFLEQNLGIDSYGSLRIGIALERGGGNLIMERGD